MHAYIFILLIYVYNIPVGKQMEDKLQITEFIVCLGLVLSKYEVIS